MIRFQSVVKHYGVGEGRVRGLCETDLKVERGEVVAIVGPSGAGKTTLLNLMGGMMRPDSGTIEINGRDLLAMDDRNLSRFRARNIGFVFQFPCMIAPLNAVDNIRLPLRFAGYEDNLRTAWDLLSRVGLEERANRMHYELSEGEKRRVCIARALVNGPKVLLCDEPTADLDSATETIIMNLLLEENHRGATVVITTHNKSLENRATRVLTIETGNVGDTVE